MNLKFIIKKINVLKKVNSSNLKNYMLFFSFLCVVVLFWLLISNDKTKVQDLNTVKSEVGNLMILPTDEEPTLLAVTDKKQVKDPFIASKSENGDQILAYAKNRIVIIYRPSLDKIVAAGDLFVDPALVESENASIVVLDGINNSIKTKQIIDKLTVLYPSSTVTDGGKTTRQDFTSTIVIDNSQKKDNLKAALVDEIHGKNGVLPLSESRTNSDIMIIVGKD